MLKYYGHAVGKGGRQAKGPRLGGGSARKRTGAGMIEKLELKEMTCAEAVKQVAHIIHKARRRGQWLAAKTPCE